MPDILMNDLVDESYSLTDPNLVNDVPIDLSHETDAEFLQKEDVPLTSQSLDSVYNDSEIPEIQPTI